MGTLIHTTFCLPATENHFHTISYGWLYTYRISHFTDISRVFSWNTPQNTKHSLYTFRISFKLHVREKINYEILLTFRENAILSIKLCKTRKNEAKYPALHFLFFVFRKHFMLFCEKCIGGATSSWLVTLAMYSAEHCAFIVWVICEAMRVFDQRALVVYIGTSSIRLYNFLDHFQGSNREKSV